MYSCIEKKKNSNKNPRIIHFEMSQLNIKETGHLCWSWGPKINVHGRLWGIKLPSDSMTPALWTQGARLYLFQTSFKNLRSATVPKNQPIPKMESKE